MELRLQCYALMAMGLAGCADASMLAPPRPIVPPERFVSYVPGEYDNSAPYYDDESQVPGWQPAVLSKSPTVYWNGRSAVGSSTMTYFGNRAEEKFQLSIQGPSSDTRPAGSSSYGGFWPDTYQHTTGGFSLGAMADCGHVANLASEHFAKITFFVAFKGFELLETSQSDGATDYQPGCPSEDKTEPANGGGSPPCPECIDEPPSGGYTWCNVRYWYDRGTGEILYWYIISCW